MMRRVTKILFLTAIAFCAATPARAEVKKFMQICDGKMCPLYEAVLTLPEGWVEDKAATKQNKVQVIVPKGQNFGSAEALIYVKVSHQDKDRTLDDLARVSEEHWRKSVPDSKISKLPDVTRANGKPAFVSSRYENPSKPQQAYEIVSFAMDSDTDGNTFSLMVVMTGRSKKALDQAQRPYQALLRTH